MAAAVLLPAFAEEPLSLRWEPSPEPDVIGYNLCVSEVDGLVSQRVRLANGDAANLWGLVPGRTYAIHVTAVTSSGLESGPSNTLVYTTPDEPIQVLSEIAADSGEEGADEPIQDLSEIDTDSGEEGDIYSAAFSQLAPGGQLSLLHSTVPGLDYLLEFDLGAFSSGAPTERLMQITVSGSAPLLTEIWSVAASAEEFSWATLNIPVQADSAVTTVTFTDISPPADGAELFLDRVQLVEQP